MSLNHREKILQNLEPLLDFPPIRRIRRNHGLEHATIHLLSRQVPNLRVVGRSDLNGFWLLGDVSTEVVEKNVNQALSRMKNGEHKLAVHPNCGTNLVSFALLGSLAALLALAGSERERFGKIQRLPVLIAALMFAAFLGQPFGMQLQKHVTTLGDPGDLQIVSITRSQRGSLMAHRVETRSS